MNPVSRSFPLPNNVERDLATRVRAPAGSVGDSVADVCPVAQFDNEAVIEGGVLMADPIALDALGPNGPYRARNRLPIPDVGGNPMAELSLVPKLYVSRAMAALRKATTLPLEDRLATLKRAGEAFAMDTVAGMTAAEYEFVVCRMSGTPRVTVRAAIDGIRHAADAYRSVQAARPVGAVNDWREPEARTGTAV